MVKPMLGFKNFLYAEATLAGIELYYMLRKGQNKVKENCQRKSNSMHQQYKYISKIRVIIAV